MPSSEKNQSRLRDALSKDELELYYQPIHDARSSQVVSAEALLRTPADTSNPGSGSELAAAAEAGPQLFEFEEWALLRAFRDAASWQKKSQVRLHVNVSARGLEEADLLSTLDDVLEATGADPARLNLEITERSFIHKPKDCVPLIDEIRARGFQVWLDDFGSGHSSITHLHLFPLDGLKIPGEYIRDLETNKCSQILVRHVIQMTKELDLLVVAENVENITQLEMLRELGCDYIQGHYFSKAMEVEHFVSFIEKTNAKS